MSPLLPVDDALARLLADAAPGREEHVPIADAAGRVLARDLYALRTQPPFDASAMDGYAVRHDDIDSVPARLAVIGESAAGGRFAGRLAPGEAVRIFTGAPLPEGADTVLLQEDTRACEGGFVEALEATARGRHIRRAGLDFREGDLLLERLRVLDPAALSLAAAANHAELPVVRKPVVAILATGTELVAPGSRPGPDQIVASNSYGIAAIARDAGARVIDLGIVPDDRALIASAVEDARAQGADVVVTLGGASVGDHDLVREVLGGLGMTLEFWKIAMRPGKPLMSGRLGTSRILGLPGNPVSSLVCAHLFLKPLVQSLGGRPVDAGITEGRLGAAMPANDHRRDYVRAKATKDASGLVVTPFVTQDSSMLRTMAEANALLIREANAPAAEAGAPCHFIPLR